MILATTASMLCACDLDLPTTPQSPSDAGLSVEANPQPQFVPSLGQQHFIYELHVRNLRSRPMFFQQIEILNPSASYALVTAFESANLIVRILSNGPGDDPVGLAPNERAIILLSYALDDGTVPARIVHRLWMQQANGEGLTVLSEEVALRTETPAVIGPPLKGSWGVANAPGSNNPHRTRTVNDQEEVRIPERFAIDLSRGAWDEGQEMPSNPTLLERSASWGADVIAVSDGVVVHAVNHILDNPNPGTDPASFFSKRWSPRPDCWPRCRR